MQSLLLLIVQPHHQPVAACGILNVTPAVHMWLRQSELCPPRCKTRVYMLTVTSWAAVLYFCHHESHLREKRLHVLYHRHQRCRLLICGKRRYLAKCGELHHAGKNRFRDEKRIPIAQEWWGMVATSLVSLRPHSSMWTASNVPALALTAQAS